MSAISVVSAIFLAISIGVLAFFIHKVAWVVRYKKVQSILIVEAARGLQSRSEAILPDWDAFASSCWRVARTTTSGAAGPAAYVRAIEQHLDRSIQGAETTPARIEPLLMDALNAGQGQPHDILQVPLDDVVLRAALDLRPPPLTTPDAPDAELYELDVKSRYGFWRRALVFFTGLADVVYSSHHVAKISQYSHVPLGTILRRMSLVVLLVLGIVLEVIVGLRATLEAWLSKALPKLAFFRGLPRSIRENGPSIGALVLWTVVIAICYFGLYFIIRRKHQQNLKELKKLRDQQESRLEQIRHKHFGALTDWAANYGRTLDAAVDLTARHVAMLGRHFTQRARRRIAGPILLKQAKEMSATLFDKLPEAEGKLQTSVTTKKTSFRHALWPHRDEMQDAVQQAQYRDAWQYVELMVNELRSSEPAPEEIEGFWRQLVIYASHFSEVFPTDVIAKIRAAYLALAEQSVEETERDIEEFGRSTRELVRALGEQLASATPLLAARIELTNQRISADAAKFEAEIIRTRERARLEAMAFEI